MINPARHHLTIYQGSIFEKAFKLTNAENEPLDLTGYTARMQVRPYPGRDPVYINLVAADITIEGSQGRISFGLDADQTAALDFDEAHFDLELLPAGDPKKAFKLLFGEVTLLKEVTA